MDYAFVAKILTGCGVVGALLATVGEIRDYVSICHLSRGDLEALYDAHHEVTSRYLKRKLASVIVDTKTGLPRRIFRGVMNGFIFGFCAPISIWWTLLHMF